ncbi:hypothetical protein vB_PsyM_KIL2_0130 [Pseudomonas phage vB_PsyM_KIL2]|nr:hypothetical protein vB_PsyM_KIL2_0130 [Pseudomonas phage vB_PsyM_KIL2]
MRASDRVGTTVGRYKILEISNTGGRNFYTVLCSGGHQRVLRCDSLVKNSDKCFDCDVRNEYYKSPTYNSWDAMVQRCTNPSHTAYEKYGGKGITTCDRWNPKMGGNFENFLLDMGERLEGMTLDRYPDKFGNYDIGNCRWASNSDQGYNQKVRETNLSGKTGVHFDENRKKWVAQITFQNQAVPLGRFDLFEDAVQARELAEIKYFGENKQ